MAWYGDTTRVHISTNHAETVKPGESCPYHGIYYCTGCGREIALSGGHKAPPQDHHQHGILEGAILWRLLVFADGRSDVERSKS